MPRFSIFRSSCHSGTTRLRPFVLATLLNAFLVVGALQPVPATSAPVLMVPHPVKGSGGAAYLAPKPVTAELTGLPQFHHAFLGPGSGGWRLIPGPRGSVVAWNLGFNLNGHYTRLRVIAGLANGLGNSGARFQVIGDGHPLYTSSVRQVSDDPINLDLKIAGVKKLVLATYAADANSLPEFVVWGDPKVYPKGAHLPALPGWPEVSTNDTGSATPIVATPGTGEKFGGKPQTPVAKPTDEAAAPESTLDASKIMVLPFDGVFPGFPNASEYASIAVGNQIQTEININPIPADQVDPTLSAANLPDTGYLSTPDLKAAAQKIDARYVVMGKIDTLEQKPQRNNKISINLVIEGRLVDAATGTTLKVATAKATKTGTKSEAADTAPADDADAKLDPLASQTIDEAVQSLVDTLTPSIRQAMHLPSDDSPQTTPTDPSGNDAHDNTSPDPNNNALQGQGPDPAQDNSDDGSQDTGDVPTPDPSPDNVFNWTEVPENQAVSITKTVFDQNGYQLTDDQGETILVPFTDSNLYVMKFAKSEDGSTYFINDGSAPVLYMPMDGSIENASVPDTQWYPFPKGFAYTQPVYLGIAGNWQDFTGMGWYPGMIYYGGYYGYGPWSPGVRFVEMTGDVFYIKNVRYVGWRDYHRYMYGHPQYSRISVYRPIIYRYLSERKGRMIPPFRGAGHRPLPPTRPSKSQIVPKTGPHHWPSKTGDKMPVGPTSKHNWGPAGSGKGSPSTGAPKVHTTVGPQKNGTKPHNWNHPGGNTSGPRTPQTPRQPKKNGQGGPVPTPDNFPVTQPSKVRTTPGTATGSGGNPSGHGRRTPPASPSAPGNGGSDNSGQQGNNNGSGRPPKGGGSIPFGGGGRQPQGDGNRSTGGGGSSGGGGRTRHSDGGGGSSGKSDSSSDDDKKKKKR